jgi:hypothetical protein
MVRTLVEWGRRRWDQWGQHPAGRGVRLLLEVVWILAILALIAQSWDAPQRVLPYWRM